LLTSLEDLQTAMHLFSQCPVHKITHLFSSDVLNTPHDRLPNRFYLHSRNISNRFSSMTNSFLCNLLDCKTIPQYSESISQLSINSGGLGLQHPLSNAIPKFMLSWKRSIRYAHQGVWLGYNKTCVPLPDPVTCLYKDWKTPPTRTMVIFRRYLDDVSTICASNADNPQQHFIFEASLNKCKE
jgi:hypothetical protein